MKDQKQKAGKPSVPAELGTPIEAAKHCGGCRWSVLIPENRIVVRTDIPQCECHRYPAVVVKPVNDCCGEYAAKQSS